MREAIDDIDRERQAALAGCLAGRRVAVTGASGFIGARVTEFLAGPAGAQVTALVRRLGAGRSLPQGVQCRSVSLTDGATLQEALAGQEILLHLAYDFRASGETNLAAGLALFDAAEEAGVSRIVLASSIAVYDTWPVAPVREDAARGAPGNGYRVAKAALEANLAARAARLASVALEPTLVYGPGSAQWTDAIAERLLAGTVVLPDGGQGPCHAVFLDDVAEAFVLAAARPVTGAIRAIVTGPAPVAWAEYYRAHAEILGRGEMAFVPRADLEQDKTDPAGERAPAGPSVAARIGGRLRSALGPAAVARLRRAALRLKRLAGARTLKPSRQALALYTATQDVSGDVAATQLGWSARTSFKAGMARTAPYLRRLYGGWRSGIDR